MTNIENMIAALEEKFEKTTCRVPSRGKKGYQSSKGELQEQMGASQGTLSAAPVTETVSATERLISQVTAPAAAVAVAPPPIAPAQANPLPITTATSESAEPERKIGSGVAMLLESMKESARVAKLLDERAKEAQAEKRPLTDSFFPVPSGITNLLATMEKSRLVAKRLDERERQAARDRAVATEAAKATEAFAKAQAAAQADAAAKASVAEANKVKAVILEGARGELLKNEAQLDKFVQLLGSPSMAPLVKGVGALLIQFLCDKPADGKAMRTMIEEHLALTLNDPDVDLAALMKLAATFK